MLGNRRPADRKLFSNRDYRLRAIEEGGQDSPPGGVSEGVELRMIVSLH